jgi:nucleoside-diphosphate-sugar epimerase
VGLKSIRVAITGSSGFIGQELIIHSAIPSSWDVRICDSVESIESLGDWAIGCILIHLSGRFSGTQDELWSSNVTLTRQFLTALRKVGGKRVIFMSTGGVYGGTLHKTGSREEDPTSPVNYYGFTKLVGEMIFEYEWRGEGRDYQILRLPNVYGIRQKKGVIYNLTKKIRSGEILQIAGDGSQFRDFLHVSDLIRAIHRVVECPHVSGHFNISSHLSLSINELVKALTGCGDTVFEFVPDDNGLQSLVLDSSKAQKILGFESLHNQLFLDE